MSCVIVEVAEMLSPGGSAGGGVSGQMSRPAKDPNWLTLEVCREFARNKCGRAEEECKFAHPPPHIDIQNGRVTCCFDSLQVIYSHYVLYRMVHKKWNVHPLLGSSS